jgi:hypothetical protein
MKIINYDYGYIFDCCIHGKIIVTHEKNTRYEICG